MRANDVDFWVANAYGNDWCARQSHVVTLNSSELARAALQLVLADFKKSLEDLQTELANLMVNFGEQADSVADLITGDARANGFTPNDPSNYGLGPNDVPRPEIPDISNIEGAFDPANDPYAAYADGVIASLDENVNGAIVVGRANFVATVRAWRSNQAALQQAIPGPTKTVDPRTGLRGYCVHAAPEHPCPHIGRLVHMAALAAGCGLVGESRVCAGRGGVYVRS